MDILITSGKINCTAKVIKTWNQNIGVEFMGIFFEENTGISTRIDGKLRNGHVVTVKGQRALIELYVDGTAAAWESCYIDNHGA